VNINPAEDSLEYCSAKVHSLLKHAFIRQTVSDVPFGTILNGGIDSTAIMQFAHEKIHLNSEVATEKSRLQTFALGLPDYDKHFEVNLSWVL